VQGEDARCFVPWAGHDPTPHEPWPARPRECRGGICRSSYGRRRTWRYGADSGKIGSPGWGSIPARGVRANQHPKPSAQTPRRWQQGQARRQAAPHAPEAPAGSERDRKTPSRQGCLTTPKVFQAPLPKPARSPGAAAPPANLPKETRQPGTKRRSRAGRERRFSPKNTEARRPAELSEPVAEPGRSRDPTTAAEPRSRERDRHSPVCRLSAWAAPAEPGARRPKSEESFTPARRTGAFA
jgi:hypothetical protein